MKRKYLTFLFMVFVAELLCDSLANNDIVPCEDEEHDCGVKVGNGSCLGEFLAENGTAIFDLDLATHFLSRCRFSCGHFLNSQIDQGRLNETMLRMLRYFGGAGDAFETLFGGRISICNLSKGWTSTARRTVIDRSQGPPRHTEHGFNKTRVPQDLWQEIKRLHYLAGKSWKKEILSSPGLYATHSVKLSSNECSLVPETVTMTSQISPRFKNRLGERLLPLAEGWAAARLVFSDAYGFRRYLEGGKCEGHVDTLSHRVIGAIINVAQDVNGHPWPLNILDHTGRHHRVFMQPGDLVWYESAKLPHGREEIFKGNFYDNLFVFFRPVLGCDN